tara:strand:+ start:1084 stop:1767 length:684 start_codon:yes stop_codon:yes gene_type:complete
MAAKIAYGSSLEALRFSAKMRTKIVLDNPTFPSIYEDTSIKQEWASLYFNLLLKGQTIGGDTVTGTHVHDDALKVVCKGGVVNATPYETLYVFSDKNIFGLPAPSKLNTLHTVVDHLTPISLSAPHISFIETADLLVNQLHLCKSNSAEKTQLYAISLLTEKELHNFDFSDTIVRFKCEDLLRKNGFEGAANGKHKRALRLTTVVRGVTAPMHRYENTEKIKFFNGN